MKITGYHVEHYLMKMDRLVGDANLPSGVEMLPGSILYLETDENVTGISLGYGGGIEGLFGAIEGADPRETVALWIRMNDWLHKGGNRGAANAAGERHRRGALGPQGQVQDEPLWRTLGAPTRVRAYAWGIDLCLRTRSPPAFYGGRPTGRPRRQAQGGPRPGGGPPPARSMREALATSPPPVLMVDANEYWSPKQAMGHVRLFKEPFDLTWVEEPARRWDDRGLREVLGRCGPPLPPGRTSRRRRVPPPNPKDAVDVYEIGLGHHRESPGLMLIGQMRARLRAAGGDDELPRPTSWPTWPPPCPTT